jgi:photosynthetic reaction center cytochrome c subunit
VIRGATTAMVILWLGSMTVVARQQPFDSRVLAQGRPQLAGAVFKNVPLLKDVPVDEFLGTMAFFSAATGLNCTDCHTEDSGGSWAKYADDSPLKIRARGMLRMMNAINATNFGGRQVVTCFTCHRGTSRPAVMPSLDLLYSSPPPVEPGDPIIQAPNQPPVDQILDTFIQAIGGAARVAALKTFTAKGSYTGFDDAEKSELEVYAAAPGKHALIARTKSGETTTWTFDGANAWLAAPVAAKPVPLIPTTGQDLGGVKLESLLRFPVALKQTLTNWRVGFPTSIDDRDVRVVQGTTPSGGTATLCFDMNTGLLVRYVHFSSSPVGRLVWRIDYSDYRDLPSAGVKMPFTWVVTALNGRFTYQLTSVQPNVDVPASRFEVRR